MCGISGQLVFGSTALDRGAYLNAHHLLKHRGPDDEGFVGLSPTKALLDFNSHTSFLNDKTPLSVVMGHRRLSIIDLSDRGHQPMGNENKKIWLAFNGEIYNYVELRKELEAKGVRFKSQTDTEVLLKGYETWGLDVLHKLDGMWAFSILDLRSNQLVLSRDRAGMKPLYYHHSQKQFLFGSELRFLKALLDTKTLNEKAAYRYLQFGLVEDQTDTLYQEIQQVPPASSLVLNLSTGDSQRHIHWTPRYRDAIVSAAQLQDTLRHSVKIHLRSDVPLGVALSGGVDSTAIACLAQGQENFHTFSVRYQEEKYSEHQNIEETLKKIKSQHEWVIPKLDTFEDELKHLLDIQEIPIRSLAVFAHLSLMKRVQEKGVKVILGGQGADELFGGYNYYDAYAMADAIKRLRWSQVKSWNPALKHLFHHFTAGFFQYRSTSLFQKPSDMTFGEEHNSSGVLWNRQTSDFRSLCLPEYLHYEDRNSMAVSVESRLPFLGRDVMEVGFSLPNHDRIHHGVRKKLLRDALQNVLPAKILNDPIKRGFVIPQEEWQQNQLKPFFEQHFSKANLTDLPLVNSKEIASYYKAYQQGHHQDWGLIWRVACFSFWRTHAFR